MFLFRKKKKMDIDAAEKFWNWFVQNEQWVIDNLGKNGSDVVWAIDAQIRPVFPYFTRELEFELGFNKGVGEFCFFHFGNRQLKADGDKLKNMMPISLQEHWSFDSAK